MFDPARLPARDSDGYLWHPDLDQFMRDRDGGPAQQEETDTLDIDAIAVAGFEARSVFVDDDPEYCDVEVEGERPAGDGWLLVALIGHEDGGTNALWVRAAAATGGEA